MPRIVRLYGKGEYVWVRHEYDSSFAMLCLTSNVVTGITKSQEMTAFTLLRQDQIGDGLFAPVTVQVAVQISNIIARVTKDCISLPDIADGKVVKVLKKELLMMSAINVNFWTGENDMIQLPVQIQTSRKILISAEAEKRVNLTVICKSIIESIIKEITVHSQACRRPESINNNLNDKRKTTKIVPQKRKSNQSAGLKRRKISSDTRLSKSICLDIVNSVIEHALYLISIKTFFIKVKIDEEQKSKCLSRYVQSSLTPVENLLFYSFLNEEDLQKHCFIEISLSKVTEIIKIKEFSDKV